MNTHGQIDSIIYGDWDALFCMLHTFSPNHYTLFTYFGWWAQGIKSQPKQELKYIKYKKMLSNNTKFPEISGTESPVADLPNKLP